MELTVNSDTVKPVCNDHLYNKMHYLWFIQECVLMKTEDTNVRLLTIGGPWPPRWAPEGSEISH